MSTQPITPSTDDSQPANVQMPQQAPPSVLAQTVAPQTPDSQVSQPAQAAPAQEGSRLHAVLSAVASVPPGTKSTSAQPTGSNSQAQPEPDSRPKWEKVAGAVSSILSTALSGIPNQGRPSFITGLGQGARAAQATEATQQNIKFRSFDDSVRAANLHHQDQELQMRTQEQQDAHQKFQDAQHDWNLDHGIEDTIVPNVGDAVVDHLTAQTSANGAASIPAGTHLSADGSSIHVPTDTQATRDGQLLQYNTFGPIYGLPSLPEGAKFVPPKLLDALTHTQQGYAVDGTPLNHDVLPQKIAALQAQREQLANNVTKNGGKPDQLTALDNTINILRANQKALDDHQDQVFKKSQAQQLDTLNKSEAIKAKYAMEKQDNAASDKPSKTDTNMYVGTDPQGNLVAGTSDDVKGLQSVHKMDTDTQKKMDAARELISPDGLFNAVAQNVKTLNASGKIGTAASRWEDFMAGKVGAGDPDFQALRTNMGLLSTKLMQAHVGARGSHEMLEHFQNLADYHIADANTLGAALKAEYKYVHGVAMLPKKAGAQ